jgi:hypothetical protein
VLLSLPFLNTPIAAHAYNVELPDFKRGCFDSLNFKLQLDASIAFVEDEMHPIIPEHAERSPRLGPGNT